jgi:hypothetical protein
MDSNFPSGFLSGRSLKENRISILYHILFGE